MIYLQYLRIYKKEILALLDISIITVSIALATFILQPDAGNIFSYYTGPTTFAVIAALLFLYAFDMYEFRRFFAKIDVISRAVVALTFSNILLGGIFFMLDHWLFPRYIFFLQWGFSLFFIVFLRCIIPCCTKPLISVEKYIIIGSGAQVLQMAKVLEGETACIVLSERDENIAEFVGTVPIFQADHINMETLFHEYNAESLVVAFSGDELANHLKTFLKLRLKGIRIYEAPVIYEQLYKKVPVDLIHDLWLLFHDGFDIYSASSLQKLKRLFDIFVTIPLLLFSLPVIVITALLIKLESEGDVIFPQERVGENDKVFTLYKLRSMRSNSEENGPKWATEEDLRVTRVGRIIRKTRIDELPQLWNILKGDMSLVGPRPEQVLFVRELEKKIPYYYMRHTVKPGVSGWAQVMYRYAAGEKDSKEKLEYDLYYIKNMSIWFDLKILFRTAGVIFFGHGAR